MFKDFKRLPAELNGESTIKFPRVTDVKEVIVEFFVSFIGEPVTAQIELLGCGESIIFIKFN